MNKKNLNILNKYINMFYAFFRHRKASIFNIYNKILK